MPKCTPIDMTGQKFGRLKVVQLNGHTKGSWPVPTWLCKCECGNEKTVSGKLLRNGKTTSCGCFQIENTVKMHTKHGKTKSPEYVVWTKMKERCGNPNNKSYKDYGARGIKMHQEWMEDFNKFYEHIGPRPSENHSIDRFPNNNGNYEPGNVRWATRKQQNLNKRNIHYITFNGKTQSLTEWAAEIGIDRNLLDARINRLGWSIERALSEPTKVRNAAVLR